MNELILPFWPYWGFGGFTMARRWGELGLTWFLTVNEGVFPNFSIKRVDGYLDYVYLAIAPGLRWYWVAGMRFPRWEPL